MKRSSILLVLLVILYPLSVFPGTPHTAPHAPGEILVKFKEGRSRGHIESRRGFRGFKVAKRMKGIPIDRIKIPDGLNVEEAISLYRARPDVEYAEPNYIRRAFKTPNDTYFSELWGLNNTGQTGGTQDADIDAPEAWDMQADCTSVVIAVLDTGADLDHVDLKDNIWKNLGEDWIDGIPGNDKEDNDRNGMIDDYYGWDFVNRDNDPSDDNAPDYHGTHVTGIIGARGNNGAGITGVCWEASIMQLKILDSKGDGTVAEELAGVQYAIANGADIINLSFGGANWSRIEYDALKHAGYAGVLVIASAGNESTDNDKLPVYPSSHNLDNIISVTATDDNDELLSWANYGLNSVDVAAPGFAIYSTQAGNGYQYASGSSMATPYVAGLAALIWAHDTSLTFYEVKDSILFRVDPKSSLEGEILTGGRINAYNSIMYPVSYGGDDSSVCFIATIAY
jgi:subtilisin family serine protease